jgi:hypothetical protein
MGIPDDARQLREAPEIWEWLEARHWITFIVDRDIKRIHVTDVETEGLCIAALTAGYA